MKYGETLPLTDTSSVWAKTAERPHSQSLAGDIDANVCVVGAGIAGLTLAYLLTKAGKRVVVLDDGEIASGMTEVTTAHLSDAIDDRFVQIEKWQGERGAALAAESHGAAIDCIEATVKELEIDCEFARVNGYLFLAPEHKAELLSEELDASRRAGLDVRLVPRPPVSYDLGPALCYPNQARFHPLKYLVAVAEAIKTAGGRIYTNSHVDHVEGGKAAKAKIGDYTVRSGSIAVATNSPINDRFVLHTKQAPYMTYVIGARVPKGSVADALYWDTEDPYHYVRIQPMRVADGRSNSEYDLLIAGGEDHKSGQADDTMERHGRLEKWTRMRFPMMEEIEFTWAGQYMETIDGLAFIGRNPGDEDNVFVVTGDSGMGMTHGTIAGILLADLIQGKENPWATLYDPSRKTLRAAGEFAKENLNVAIQYTDWIAPSEVKSVDEIAFGSGAVLRRGLSRVAVYRDEAGKCHEMSATCPHLSCIVHWNGAEKSWDCPCHGSRFDKLGKVINGPANIDLSPSKD
jgi:glycine/D-amino acid oxidase-like deaminating enzyme/nitrite reductase/ring-hydroxylating ferredoxin subunit